MSLASADQLPWDDPSVQAMLPFPSVLVMTVSDLNWTNHRPWDRSWENRTTYNHPYSVQRYEAPRRVEQHPLYERTQRDWKSIAVVVDRAGAKGVVRSIAAR